MGRARSASEARAAPRARAAPARERLSLHERTATLSPVVVRQLAEGPAGPRRPRDGKTSDVWSVRPTATAKPAPPTAYCTRRHRPSTTTPTTPPEPLLLFFPSLLRPSNIIVTIRPRLNCAKRTLPRYTFLICDFTDPKFVLRFFQMSDIYNFLIKKIR